jgi:hypothetical protein
MDRDQKIGLREGTPRLSDVDTRTIKTQMDCKASCFPLCMNVCHRHAVL